MKNNQISPYFEEFKSKYYHRIMFSPIVKKNLTSIEDYVVVVYDQTNNMAKKDKTITNKSMRFGDRKLVADPDWQKLRWRVEVKKLMEHMENVILEFYQYSSVFATEEENKMISVLRTKIKQQEIVIATANKKIEELTLQIEAGFRQLLQSSKNSLIMANKNKPSPDTITAIDKMGKTPHAAWRSIVDNENEGQL